MARGNFFRLAQQTIFAVVLVLSTSCGGGGGDSINIGGSSQSAEPIVRWNRIAIDASGRDHSASGAKQQTGPVRSIRAVVMAQIAMADAVAAVTKRFKPYIEVDSVEPNTSVRAAIAQAGHDTLVELFSAQRSIFEQELAKNLAEIEDGEAKTNGIALGKKTARNILTKRTADGSELGEPFVPITYQPKSAPGKWRPDPINPGQKGVGATWSGVTPFLMISPGQFRTPPPPALDSPEYAVSFEEVKRLGGDGITTPTERTEEQTEIGIYWAYDGTPSLCAPPRLYNQIAVKIGEDHNLGLEDMTRMLALINLAMCEAGSASWESKYFYEFWRPVTGIREADAGTGPTGLGDGNDNTIGDTSFTPLGAPASNLSANNFTPPFPAYPSGHATFGGALFETLRNFYGTDDISFSFVSDEFNGVTTDNQGNVRPLRERHFSSLSQAEEENGQSRIYLGIHWSFDKTEGINQGRRVADLVFQSAYQELDVEEAAPSPSPSASPVETETPAASATPAETPAASGTPPVVLE